MDSVKTYNCIGKSFVACSFRLSIFPRICFPINVMFSTKLSRSVGITFVYGQSRIKRCYFWSFEIAFSMWARYINRIFIFEEVCISNYKLTHSKMIRQMSQRKDFVKKRHLYAHQLNNDSLLFLFVCVMPFTNTISAKFPGRQHEWTSFVINETSINPTILPLSFVSLPCDNAETTSLFALD